MKWTGIFLLTETTLNANIQDGFDGMEEEVPSLALKSSVLSAQEKASRWDGPMVVTGDALEDPLKESR